MNASFSRRVVISGGPGVGKTTLLRELAARGCRTIEESAREVIRERKAVGLPPRPDAAQFAREILARDTRRYELAMASPQWTFFDRCALESAAMLSAAGALPDDELASLVTRFTFHRMVFVLPPWRDIYTTDEERDHDFDHCVRVHDEVVRCYRGFAYEVHEVPRLAPQARAEYVLRVLDREG